ncbi:MAG: N-acyl homoserine lactonase family protein [Hyphomicrobiales bacterium]|nr:N-acyl homoserine lactonase family protein [Hyphomicrobiales bacterium]
MAEHYEILAVKYAEKLDRVRADNFIMDDRHDAPGPMDYFVWVVRNATRTIVVDTGYEQTEADSRNRRILRSPQSALAVAGIDAAAVETVVITHMHYDHAGTLGSFPKAQFHLQAAEMAFATGPCMCHDHMRYPFTADHVCQMVRNIYSGRVTFWDGDGEVAPGITVHKIGGHSRGLQAVRVATAGGPVVLASDASHYYENFERGKPFPIVVDMVDVLGGYATLKSLAGTPRRVIPGHDPLVLARYPAVNDASRGIVHRLDVARTD